MITEATIQEGIAGEYKAFHLIYKKLFGKLYPICLRYSNNVEEAKDWCQEAFVRLFSNLSKFSGNMELFERWARNLFRNYCIDQYRKKSTKKQIAIEYREDVPENINDEINEVDLEALKSLQVEQLLDIIQTKLRPIERIVFNMYVFDDYNLPQIASEFEMNLNTVKAIYYRSKIKIRNELETYIENGISN